VVHDVVSGPQKLIDCLSEECGVVTAHVEFDRNSTPHFHTSDACLMSINVGEKEQQSVVCCGVVGFLSGRLVRFVHSSTPEFPPRNC
jgi:hypothetical protein